MIQDFKYKPQNKIGVALDTSIYKNDSIRLIVEGYVPGANDKINWFKNNVRLAQAKLPTYFIEQTLYSDSGDYLCFITNPLFPGLVLGSEKQVIEVLQPVGNIERQKSKFSIYPNPASTNVFVNTENETVTIEIYSSTGQLVFRKEKFTSGWINIEDFKKGIYLFQLKSKTDKTWIKKVVLR